MSVFDIKKSSSWNYSNDSKPGFSNELSGALVGMDNPQARDFNTGKKRYFSDGNPMRNIRLFIATADGEKSVTFRSGSALFSAFAAACGSNGMSSLTDAIGYKVTIKTERGVYNQQNPRPWDVLIGEKDEGVKLHKVPVIDYDTIDPVSGKAKEDSDIPF